MEESLSSPGESNARPRRDGLWVFPALLAVVLLVAFLVGRYRGLEQQQSLAQSTASWTPSPRPEGQTAQLAIEFGNGVSKHFAALEWREGMTVAELMQEAEAFRPGITFVQVGTGGSGFLTAIDGLANEGAGGRNWLFEVDGKSAEESFCLHPVGVGSRVLWKFVEKE